MTSNDLSGKTLEIVKRKKTGVTAAMVSMIITTDVEDFKSSTCSVLKPVLGICDILVRIRIREAQKHADPDP
jgi:hypothetical protein